MSERMWLTEELEKARTERDLLRARNAEFVAALAAIGKQRTSDELDVEENANADYQFAYDACVARARAALAAAGRPQGSGT